MTHGDRAAPLLEVRDLVTHFPIRGGLLRRRRGTIHAVDGVSFDLRQGETLGLVGESGSGKSTVARTLMRLEEATGGTALYQGTDILRMSGSQLRRLRRDIQMIYQDPYTSLNPRMSVRDTIKEAWRVHSDIVPADGWDDRVEELLAQVGLDPASAGRYPHEFSGGQRQRVGIARALALDPKIIICDEPVSALDVSVQSQVMNLLKEIQERTGVALLFIAHDLSVVRHISDRVAVMYLGRIVEIGSEDDIYERPVHPYTQALLSAVPVMDPGARGRPRIPLVGEIPSPAAPPSGCNFRTRCWKAQAECAEVDPSLETVAGEPAHEHACHFPEPVSSAVEQAGEHTP